jgi:hypothetical protein
MYVGKKKLEERKKKPIPRVLYNSKYEIINFFFISLNDTIKLATLFSLFYYSFAVYLFLCQERVLSFFFLFVIVIKSLVVFALTRLVTKFLQYRKSRVFSVAKFSWLKKICLPFALDLNNYLDFDTRNNQNTDS